MANYDKQKMIEIYTINGQRVLQLTEMSNSLNLDVSKLKAGVYVLRVRGTDGTLVSQEKFVKE